MYFKFKPLLKQTLWGGDGIVPFKHLTETPEAALSGVGESWEISGVKGDETIVAEGPYAGKTLGQLVELLGEKLVGADNYKTYGGEFPLLIKFIDAAKDLSIQVHPTDEKAAEMGKGRGKTEMWYVIKADDAHLLAGLKSALTPEQYKAKVADHSICDAIARYDVHPDDCFFIPAGRIHSIGKGCFVAEIQQTSDTTYRIYDFNRRDAEGRLRELHTEDAAKCIDYQVLPDYRTAYTPKKDEGVELVGCKYFHTSVYDLTEPMTLDYSDLDSFVILIPVAGCGELAFADGSTTPLTAGESVLLSADETEVSVSGEVKFLEVWC